MNIINMKSNVKSFIWAISALLLLNGCTALTNVGNSFFGNTDTSKKVVKEDDRWLENESRWKNWDTGHPNNQLVAWSYLENALITKLSAGKDLNTFSQRSHTLAVKVIQLSDVSGLKTLLQTTDGISIVLSQATEMIPNAVYSDFITLAPKQVQTLIAARQQDVKFVAIVSGFAELNVLKSVKIITIPVITVPQYTPKKESLFDTLTLGVFAEEQPALPDIVRPAIVRLDVKFGRTGISGFVATAL
jgi:predicted component of type VI protein secretion system